jgi:Peptidase family M13
MTPATVNAYFNPPANEVGSSIYSFTFLFTGVLQIVFPAGILRPPFFNKDWPAYLNYGAFGQVASHELTVSPDLLPQTDHSLIAFDFISTLLIRPDAYTTRKAS